MKAIKCLSCCAQTKFVWIINCSDMSRSLTDSKSKHEVVMDLINKVADITVKLGVVHQNTQDEVLDGRHITLEGQRMLYFGSCGYLGLEHDSRLKKGAIEAIQKYGTQFSSSRAYVSSTYYQQAESLLSQIFANPSCRRRPPSGSWRIRRCLSSRLQSSVACTCSRSKVSPTATWPCSGLIIKRSATAIASDARGDFLTP